MVKRIGSMYAVVHGHEKKEGSKTDKRKGAVIHKFKTKEEAQKMHIAIMLSEKKRGK